MTLHKIFVWILTACLLIGALSGCADTGGQSESGQNSISQPPEEESDAFVANPERLASLWDRYLLPAELYLDNFQDAGTLSPFQTTYIAFRQFVSENDIKTLSRVEDPEDYTGTETYLWPLDTAAIWVELSFGLPIDNPEEYFSRVEDENSYGPIYSIDHNALLFRTDEGEPWGSKSSYPLGERNPWGFTLGDVTEKPDGSVVAEINSVVDYESMLVDHTRTFTLGRRDTGDYCFISAEIEYRNNNRAAMAGSFRQLDCLNEELGYWIANCKMIGEDGDSIFLYFDDNGFSGDNDIRLSRIWKIDVHSGEITARLQKEMEVDINNGVSQSIRNTGDGFLLMDKNHVYKYDYDLTLVDTYAIPEAIKAKMKETLDEDRRFRLEFFAGYDMSEDGSMFYYSGHEGLWSYRVADDTHKLLVPPQKGEGRLMEGTIISPSNLRLVDGDSKILYTIYGYEGIASQNCLDLQTLEDLIMPSAYYGSFNGTYFGSGHMAIDMDRNTVARYFDFATGQSREAPIQMESGMDPAKSNFQFDMVCPVGKEYGLTGVQIEKEQGASQFILYRIRLAEMEVQKLDFDIHVSYTPLGILSDGTAVIYYHVNEAEQGIVLIGS